MTTPKTEVDVKSRENFLVPKLWHGMSFGAWWNLLRANHFDVAPSRLPMAFIVTLFSIQNSLMGWMQSLVFGRRIEATEIKRAPVFVIGHYRSGTTLLQELLCSDERHTFPTTYECFAPQHFLLTEKLFAWWLNLTMPKQRLADGMRQGADKPQEDEAAMCCLGLPSRYHRFAFPNREHGDEISPDLDKHAPATVERWKETFTRFLQQVTLVRPRRIVLKSPQHTCRIKHLAELFPDARFVYIVRDPHAVFPSTVRLWKVIHESQALQRPHHDGLEEVVLDEFAEMHDAVRRDADLIDESRFCVVHYEDLVADPLGELGRIYESVELGDLEPARAGIEAYLDMTADYKTRPYELSDAQRCQIEERWGDFMRHHGYAKAETQSALS